MRCSIFNRRNTHITVFEILFYTTIRYVREQLTQMIFITGQQNSPNEYVLVPNSSCVKHNVVHMATNDFSLIWLMMIWGKAGYSFKRAISFLFQNKPVLRMRAPLATLREPEGVDNRLPMGYIFLNIKRNIFLSMHQHCGILTYQWYTPKDLIVKFLQYPHTLYSSNICEILLYSRQLVVLLISLYTLFGLLTARGKYNCEKGLPWMILLARAKKCSI